MQLQSEEMCIQNYPPFSPEKIYRVKIGRMIIVIKTLYEINAFKRQNICCTVFNNK